MSNIEKIDKNFRVETTFDKENIKFYDVLEAPFSIHGLIYSDGKFRRLPEEIAAATNDGVNHLHANTAGGRVRFVTDSSYVAISAKMPSIGKMPHFALTGSAGFDMYVKIDGKEKYAASFMPPFRISEGYDSIFDFKTRKMREITINFPLYSDVSSLYIGIENTAKLEKASPYSIEKPMVFYGSSVTQGGCASRPGNVYSAILTRKFDIDHINLGFSGSAKGEDVIAEYMANMDMRVFVYDYDHNAPTAEHLEKTHERVFKIIREKNPDLPIIIMSAVSLPRCVDDRPRRTEIIRKTYENAINSGDKNVYFIDGRLLMEEIDDVGTVDGCHPNDLGYFFMAQALEDVIKDLL